MKKRKFKTSKIKRIISVVFILALLLTVFPISSASSKSVAEFSFNYAYDCSRSPAFPKAGDSFVASNLQNPLIAFEESGTTTHGNWKLTSKGIFTGNDSDYEGANYCEWCSCIELKSVVESIADIYNISADKVDVFELTESNNHIAYGVLCALSDNVAAFIGDTWDGGAGYVLGVEELSDPYTTTINLDLTTGFVNDAHILTYNVGEGTNLNKITAICTNKNHSNDNCYKTGVSIALKPTSPNYSGSSTGWDLGQKVAFSLDGTSEWQNIVGNDTIPEINYEGTGSTTYGKSVTAPSAEGTYKATITVDNATAEVPFFILDKESAKKAIAEIADPYSAYRIVNAAEKAKKNVDAQTTPDGVAKAKADGIQAVKDAIYAQELADAKEDAIIEVGFYSGEYLSSNAKKIVSDANKKINSAKTVEAVRKIVDQTKRSLDIHNKLDNPCLINSNLKVSSSSKGITAKWGKASGANGYIVYGAYCGDGIALKPIKTIANPKVTTITFSKLNGKKLNTKKNVKLYVLAYKNINGKKVVYGKSIITHVAGSGSKAYTNAKSVSVNKTIVTLKAKKTFTIKATVNKVNNKKSLLNTNHAAKCRYASSNTAVATVSARGKITAKSKGTCTVYVYALNGCTKKITVTVK